MDIYDNIINEYTDGTAIKEISRKLAVSEVKVRRVLITEGLWRSSTSMEICALYCDGLTPDEIAERLEKPVKTVQAYLPYSRGEYGREDMSDNAKWSKEYRNRKKQSTDRQIHRNGESVMKRINNVEDKSCKVLKLHMELCADLDDEAEETLKRYGKMKESISRDILVSENMLLHNLHYAIQKVFGWQNSHLHNFAYPAEAFSLITKDNVQRLFDLMGIYFRFPDNEDEDIYWDDDYDGSVSPKTWLKRKYSAPYYYGGMSEHYMIAQAEAKAFQYENPVLRIGPSFEEYMNGKRGAEEKRFYEVTIPQMQGYFESGMDELLERLPIGQVIGVKAETDWEKKVDGIVNAAEVSFNENYKTLNGTEEDLAKVLEQTNPVVVPISDKLVYSYDYGDGWQVEITCVAAFEADSDEAKVVNAMGKPVCVAADGLPVLDDVGGIYGFCGFLRGIHGEDCGPYPYEDKEEAIAWGRSQGWRGMMNKVENIL